MDAHDTKRCAKCWRYLPLDDFGHDETTSDNLTYRCNSCRTAALAIVETITTANHFHPDR